MTSPKPDSKIEEAETPPDVTAPKVAELPESVPLRQPYDATLRLLRSRLEDKEPRSKPRPWWKIL